MIDIINIKYIIITNNKKITNNYYYIFLFIYFSDWCLCMAYFTNSQLFFYPRT